jgi:hypothetical protein
MLSALENPCLKEPKAKDRGWLKVCSDVERLSTDSRLGAVSEKLVEAASTRLVQ